ncbi:MAG: maleylacetoacetate isomerase [Pseudomonadota bacterium]
MTLRLHNFFRSSTSTRLRAALNLKGLGYVYVPYVLRAGETRMPEYLAKNPQGLVPTLELGDGTCLSQSVAILEWLEETHPEPALLPRDPIARARVRAMVQMIACEIHPLNNLRVLFRLRDQFGADEAAQNAWFIHWVTTTFDALETQLDDGARYCLGDVPTLADVSLYAQVWNNRRFDIDVANWRRIAGVFAHLDSLEPFANAAPPRQPDAA